MEYGWWNQGYNYKTTPNSYEDLVPMSACNLVCCYYGGNHYSSMCSNPHQCTPYIHEQYYHTTPQVLKDLSQRMPKLCAALEYWDKHGNFNSFTFPSGQPSSEVVTYSHEYYEIDDSSDPIVSVPVQPT